MTRGLVAELVTFAGFVTAVGICWHGVEKIDAVVFETSPVIGAFVQRLVIKTVTTFTLNVEVTRWRIGLTSFWISLSGRTIHCVNRLVAGSDKHTVALDLD